jgi:hypothetical protein
MQMVNSASTDSDNFTAGIHNYEFSYVSAVIENIKLD